MMDFISAPVRLHIVYVKENSGTNFYINLIRISRNQSY